MGQRLVILNSTPFIQTNDQLDTNAIYYHWSAYTDSDVEKIKKIKLNIDLYNIPLSESEYLYDKIPEYWYEPSIDRIYSHIA